VGRKADTRATGSQRGLALISLSKGDELAWYDFDLFAPQVAV
jgi:hypothetical protein